MATARMPSVPVEEGGIDILRRATIGEYEILTELGRGGMATVYLAHEISLDRKVAIKVMAPQLMFGEGMAERFRREARTAASLSHPHIIPIYAVKEAGRVLFFVMKFIAGRPLDDIVREVGPLPIPMVRAILSQVGGALGYAHRRGIIHRDIKPANIMIDDEGWAVVTDFGIAKVAETQGLTMTGVAVGTPSFMSPEQCAAKEVTGRSDQYSLGIVAYEMITGKQPFVADTAMAIMWQHFNDPPRPIRELRPDCPPALESAILRMLEKQPDKRWSSIEDATAAIGATPLSHDDPIRLQMVGLAKTSLNQRLLDEMKTPTSLVPPTRASGKQGTEAIPSVGSVAVSPRSVNLAAGETIQLSVIVQDTGGDTVAGRTVKWTSERPAIAAVSESGMVTAASPGEAVISATCEGQTGGCQITVTPVHVSAVLVSPPSGTIQAGATLQLTATIKDSQGKAITGREISWSSSAPALAAVSTAGMVTGSIAGSAKITAMCEGKTGSASVTITEAPVGAVNVVPSNLSLDVGQKGELNATVTNTAGKPMTRQVSWNSRNPAAATVAATGTVTGTGTGKAEIVASCEGKTATVTVTVTPVAVARVAINAPLQPLEVGETAKLAATAQDGAGARLDRPIHWSSSLPAVASVAADGTVTAHSEGSAEVSAESEGKRASVSVKVVPVPVASVGVIPPTLDLMAGSNAQLSAVIKDARGRELHGRPVAWSSSKPAVASVNNGRVTAAAAGIAVVVATVEGKRATVDVRVTAIPAPTVPAPTVPAPTVPAPAPPPPPVQDIPTQKLPAHPSEPAIKPAPPPPPVLVERKSSRLPLVLAVLAVLIGVGVWKFGPWGKSKTGTTGTTGTAVALVPSPATQTMNVGDSLAMSVQFNDAQGNPVDPDRAVTWSSDNPGVAFLNGNYVKAVGGGTATVIGESQGLRGTAIITVSGTPVPGRVAVATVTLGSVSRNLTDGESVQLAASARDDKGAVLDGRPVSWTSSNPGIVEVSPTGLAVARSDGSATITATSEGKSATIDFTVAPAPVASVAVTPSRVSMEVGETVTLSAEARDARGTVLVQRPFTWTSSKDGVARVGADGNVTGAAVGTTTITVAAGGKRGTASITVVTTRVDVASITISPASGQLTVGERVQLDAQLKDSRGTVLRDRTPSWSSSNTEVAAVSPSGQVTANAPGTATMTASSDNQRATVRIEVAAAPVGTVVLTAPPPSLPIGESFQLGGTVRDARGGLLLDRTISWTSNNAKVAPVTAGGLVTAVGAGTARITATVEGKTASVTITVPAPVAVVTTVAMAPSSAALEVGETVQLTAIPQDARGAPMDRPITWSSSNAGVASVSRAGLVSAVGAGSATISAASEGRTGTIGVTVTARPGPDSIVVIPPNPSGAIARSSLVAGGAFTCGLVSGGSLACWGAGQTTPALLGGQRFSRLSAGTTHVCGLTSGGDAYCWGQNSRGQIGDGTTNNTRVTPVAVVGGLSFRVIRAGGTHTCALTGAGKAYCWGENKDGQLGDGSTSGRTRPVPIPDLSFTDISAGGKHGCGIATTGKTYCWGDGFSGQLGQGMLNTEPSPVEVSSNVKFTRIYAGGGHSCGLTAGGKAYCWGDNRAGQVGDGGTTDRTQPVEVQTNASFEELSLGASHTCGRTSGGSILCWGAGGKGQLGTGGRANQSRPARVVGEGPFTSVSAGVGHTCAATATQAFCWGENARGQLGDGSTVPKPAPTVVLGAN